MATPLDSVGGIFSGGMNSILQYWWIIAAVVVITVIGAVVWWVKKFKQKNSQWTHKLIVQFEQANGDIDEKEGIINMRRWKHKDEKTAPLFELQTPLIGSRIFVELEKYSGKTTYKVVLGNDGRLYIPKSLRMSKDKSALEVSVKHAGIDRARQQYNLRFEQMNATPSKIDALTLLKYGLYATALIVFLVLGIVGIKAWGDRASYDAAAANAELQSWEKIKDVMISMDSVANTQALMIPDLKKLYGDNLQSAIRNQKKELNNSNG